MDLPCMETAVDRERKKHCELPNFDLDFLCLVPDEMLELIYVSAKSIKRTVWSSQIDTSGFECVAVIIFHLAL